MNNIDNKINNKIEIGMPVIINTTDAPCTKLIAIVSKITPNLIEAMYLTDETTLRICSTSRPQFVTPVSDFGVQINIAEGKIWVNEVVGESKAKYEDGRPRYWQEHGFFKYNLNNKAFDFYEKCLAMEPKKFRHIF